jgi:hypothetical protein
MADYKRMVSYMYQYENGVKKKNVGYARVESRNRECKITLHMQMLGQIDSIFPVYLIQRDETEMNLIYLGDSVLKSQIMDSKLTADEYNVLGTGYKFSDIGGILLFLNENVFFATEWDDKLIIAEEVMKAMQPKEVSAAIDTSSKEVFNNASAANSVVKEQLKEDTQNAVIENKQEPVMDEYTIPKYKLPRGLKTIERLQNPLAFGDDHYKKTMESSQNIPQPVAEVLSNQTHLEAAGHEVVDKPREGKETGKGYLYKPNEIKKKYKQAESRPSMNKVKEDNAVIDKQEEAKEIEAESEYHEVAEALDDLVEAVEEVAGSQKEIWETKVDTESEIKEVKTAVDEDESRQAWANEAGTATEYGPYDPIYFNKKNNDTEKMVMKPEEEGEKPDPPTAIHFFEQYTRIYPFEDNEITSCVKIEPKDIGFLSKDAWTLSNNSFLLHGYYSYQHLIFAKIKDRYGCRYILGVPGIYHNRERFMARMFGFESFKSIRKRELRQGDFGYWYIALSL